MNAESQSADLIVRGSHIHSLDPEGTTYQTFAVADGVIIAASANSELDELVGENTQIIEIDDSATVMPGLGDIHTHTYVTGHSRMAGLQIDAAWSGQEVLQAIEKAAVQVAEGTWVIGGYLEQDQLQQLTQPGMLTAIDSVSHGRALMIRDSSMHARVVNSEALEILSADSEFPAIGSPEVPVDVAGQPLGALFEAASGRAERLAELDSPSTTEQLRASVAEGVRVLNSLGVTHFQDAAAGLQLLKGASALYDSGELNAWITNSLSINDLVTGSWPQGRELVEVAEQYDRPQVRSKYAKIFMDGTPFSCTAAMHGPYLESAGFGEDWHGEPGMSAEVLGEWFSELSDRGLGAKVHAAGDRAASMALDALEALRATGRDMPLQLAHASLLREEDWSRVGRLGVTIDASPGLWYPNDFTSGVWDKMPEGTALRSCRWRDAVDAGAQIAGGTDIPCAGLPNHWVLIETLITREHPEGAYPGKLLPEQALSREEAIAAFTTGAARAAGILDRTGSLEVGKQADFIVVDQNPMTVPVQVIGETKVIETWFKGKKVYEAEDLHA